MATKLYVWWGSSNDPPSPWAKESNYNGKYVRFVSDPSSALTTGGSATHTHSLGTGHTINNAGDYGNLNSGSAQPRKSWASYGHNHAIGTIAISSADNAPSYYTVSLISMDLATFFSSHRKIPKDSIVASTADISGDGLSKIANNRLIKLGSSPASTGGSNSHSHSFSGSLSSYSDTYTYADWGSYEALATAQHSHALTGLSLESKSSLPARIQTRLFRVTADYTDKIPANAVMFVDGSITGYTDKLEIITAWNNRMIEAADSDPTDVGSDSHNHGSSVSGNTDTVGGSATKCKNYAAETEAMSYGHVHSVTINLSTTDVSLLPPYVNLVPVKVKSDIIPSFTGTKSITMDVLVQKTVSKSYGMGMKLNPSGLSTKTKTYIMDSLLAKKSIVSYRMSLAPLFKKKKDYNMGLRIVLLDVIPRAKVIDVLQDSWIIQYNKLLQTIEASRYGLTLDGASSYDLDRKFGRAFNLPRDPGENDTNYRERIKAYTSSIVGCGTKPVLLSLLNAVTLGENARIDVYPGLIRVYFDNDFQCSQAVVKRDAIEKILNTAVAAGVQWMLYFPYKHYQMDLLLKKLDITKTYSMDSLVQKRGLSGSFSMDLELVFQMIKSYHMDTFILKTCSRAFTLDTLLQKRGATQSFDLKMLLKAIKGAPYDMDTLIKKTCKSSFTADTMVLKTLVKGYALDTLVKNTEYKFYNLACILKKQDSCPYGMGLVIVNE